MTFKPSSIRKLFFTYICPTFYGSPPAAPSNTTSTQTINQSPWQNPVYQALMLGTADKPGPITSMLRSSAEQTAAYNDMLKGGYSPVPMQPRYTSPYTPPAVATPPAAAPIQEKAQGGIMSLQGYAGGGAPKKETPADKYARIKASATPSAADTKWAKTYSADQIKALNKAPKNETADQKNARLQKIVDFGGTPSAADTTFMNNYMDSSANTYKGTIDPKTGVESLRARGATESAADYKKYTDEALASGAAPTEEAAKQTADANLKNTIGTAITAPTADVKAVTDAAGNITGYESTNKDFLALQEAARKAAATPQAGFETATKGLEAAANYKPTDVTAQKADVAGATATGYEAKNMAAPTDISAQKADVAGATATGYEAKNMAAPTDISAQKAGVTNAEASKYTAANMAAPTDISAKDYDASLVQGAKDISADKLQQYQMQGPKDINAPTAKASQMAGPKSWIDKGTSEAYMSPYMQNVVDIQKREANRDYQQQLNQLNAQSVQAGAFGGSRQAIQQAEAARNQATRLGDIEAKGLQEAYASGMGQFTNEQGQQLQAGQANLSASQQTTLANQAAEIQAMMANQGMDYNTALQNLQAKLGIQNTQAGNDLQAALANQQTQQQTQTINADAINKQRSLAVQNALDAAKINYGGQLTKAQADQIAKNTEQTFNAANAQDISKTNAAAANLSENSYVQNALDAAKINYGGQLTKAQADQVAQNAAAQYNATNTQNVNLTNAAAANTSENAYVQQALEAARTNYGGQLTAEQQNQVAQNASAQYNATNAQNVNLATQQAQNTANQQLTAQQLAAQQANQQAGLTANQQGIGALQGVASTATAANEAGIANLGVLGKSAQAQQDLSQFAMGQNQQTAINSNNFTNQANAGVVAGVNAQPVTAGTTVGTVNAPKARGGLIKNGKVSKRGMK